MVCGFSNDNYVEVRPLNQCFKNHILWFNFCIVLSLPVPVETEDQQRLRFQVELEFVQCLANPNYLHCKYKFSFSV